MGSEHNFGGPWTEQKLKILSDYLRFYTQALKKQPFQRMYVDAFAGTGEIGESGGGGPDLFGNEERQLLAGSARIALESEPPFDRYVFFDINEQHVAALSELEEEFGSLDIHIERSEANAALQELARRTNWRRWRAVVFLDPYGAQVEWETLVSLAETKAVDVWLLVPFGVVYNRMLPHSGEVPEGWAKRLSLSFGTDGWREVAYETTTTAQSSLFPIEEEELTVNRRRLEEIEQWFIEERLKSIFPGVSEPVHLTNSTGSWLYSLIFAVANPRPKAKGLALKVAKHILNNIED